MVQEIGESASGAGCPWWEGIVVGRARVPSNLVSGPSVIIVAGIEVLRVKPLILLANPCDVGGARLFIKHEAIGRAALRCVSQVLVDARVDEREHEGRQDQGGQQMSVYGGPPLELFARQNTPVGAPM